MAARTAKTVRGVEVDTDGSVYRLRVSSHREGVHAESAEHAGDGAHAEIAEGVRVVATPGHTVGHQSVMVDTPDGGAVMIGDAAYTADIYREGEMADLSSWGGGQYSDRKAWSNSLRRLHAMRPHSVHFCHDTRVVSL